MPIDINYDSFYRKRFIKANTFDFPTTRNVLYGSIIIGKILRFLNIRCYPVDYCEITR